MNNKWKCNWLNCAYGMCLAGMNFCHVPQADPMNSRCPKFITEEELEAEQEKNNDNRKTTH